MKRYMVWWGALFFLVMFTSLYLMLETVTSPNTGSLARSEAMEGMEGKIHLIEQDLNKNKELIADIKNWVGLLAKGDDNALGHLVKLVNEKSGDVDAVPKQDDTQVKEVKDQAQKPVAVPDAPKQDSAAREAVKPGEIYEVSPGEKVAVSGSMCSLSSSQGANADIDLHQVVENLPFDNVDGGAWKQGWDVKYDPSEISTKKLKIFVVPHSHCDPGWIKTYKDYYRQQTRNIFENMLPKMEEDARRKFIFAEISYFSLWWDELDAMRKDRVKKLIDGGRLEIVTGGWVMPDEANTHYFAIIDQLLEGHQWLNGTLGVRPKSGWSVDPFGYSSTMAYLLKRTGFENMLIQRVHYSMKKYLSRQQSLEFQWRQQWDSEHTTDMFCHAMPFYSYDVPHTCGPDPKVCCQFDFRRLPGSKYNCPWKIPPQAITDSNVAERARTLLDQYRKKSQLYKTSVVLAPLGDDFRYDKPDEWDLQYNNYQKLFDYINKHPELGAEGQFGTLTDYFDAVHEETKQTPSFFPSLSGDFFTYADRDDHYWSGYFTSRPFHKNMDRVVEANLRSAEIVFTLAQAYARKNTASNFPSVEMMKKLVTARRSLGLFQHHDGITGTAKDFVVNDYGARLLEGLTGAKQVMAESAAFLVVKDKGQYQYDAAAPLLDLDQVREAHDSLPLRPIIQLSSTPTPVIVYNSLGHRRVQLVSVFVTQASVEVTNPYGSVVHSQTQPFFVDANTVTDGSRFKVSFVAEVPALGVAVYTLRQAGDGQDTKNHLASTTFINPKSSVNSQGAFSIRSTTGNEDFSIKNSVLEATFDGSSGLLKLVKTLATGEERKTYVKFALFGARNTKEKSGAYLFLPDGPGQSVDEIKPVIRITRGPMVSEVHVFTKYVHHVVRLVNTPGVDALSLDIHNVVDIRTLSNREISMRIHTDIANDDRIFYTDLNGFQMQRRQTYDKLPLQGNVYPMPSAMFIQDSATRFSILSAQSLGVLVSKPGQVDIMLDRRLNQDDGRGLQQGVVDNRLTPNHFRLLLETRTDATQTKSPAVAFPSHLSNVASLHLMQPLFTMPRSAKHADTPLTFLSEFSPMNVELPCEVHLVNLRTLQNKDDSADLKYVPRDSAAMLLHHMGGDCSFPLHGVSCRPNDGKVSLAQMFSELKLNGLHETTLTLMHDLEEVDAVMEYPVPPMEIKTFKASLS